MVKIIRGDWGSELAIRLLGSLQARLAGLYEFYDRVSLPP